MLIIVFFNCIISSSTLSEPISPTAKLTFFSPVLAVAVRCPLLMLIQKKKQVQKSKFALPYKLPISDGGVFTLKKASSKAIYRISVPLTRQLKKSTFS